MVHCLQATGAWRDSLAFSLMGRLHVILRIDPLYCRHVPDRAGAWARRTCGRSATGCGRFISDRRGARAPLKPGPMARPETVPRADQAEDACSG